MERTGIKINRAYFDGNRWKDGRIDGTRIKPWISLIYIYTPAMLLPSTIDLRPSPLLPLVSPARPQFAGDRKWLKIAATRLIASRWLQLRLPTRRNLASSSSSIDLPPPLTIYEPAYLQVSRLSSQLKRNMYREKFFFLESSISQRLSISEVNRLPFTRKMLS